jgi:hypothetical protein
MNNRVKGMEHWKVTKSPEVVARCRFLNKRGFGAATIVDRMKDEGHHLNMNTVGSWLYSKKRRMTA